MSKPTTTDITGWDKRAGAVFEALFCRLNGLPARSVCVRVGSVGKSGDDGTPIKRIDPDSTESGCEEREQVRVPTFELSAEYFAKCSERECEGAFRGAWAMHVQLTGEPERAAAAKASGKKFVPRYGKSIRNGLPRGPGKGKSSAQRKDCRAVGVKLDGDRDIGLRWSVKSACGDTKATLSELRAWWDVSLGLTKSGAPISTEERDTENAKRRKRRAEKRAEAEAREERGEVNFSCVVHQDDAETLQALIDRFDGDSVKAIRLLIESAELTVAETVETKAA